MLINTRSRCDIKLLRQFRMTTQKRFVSSIILLGLFHCIKFTHGGLDGQLNENLVKHNKNCTEQTETFSADIHQFNNCAIKQAEPVKYCMHCGDPFTNLVVGYNNIVNNETCKAELFNQDRLNILEIIYLSAVSLWEAGSCSSCYDWVEPSDKQFEQNKSEKAVKFFEDLNSFVICESSNTKKAICVNCLGEYNKVNDLYNIIKDSSKDQICFDIKDAMNKTRLHWSRDLNCCKDRKSSLTAFIVTSVVLSGLIPFVFYTGFMFFSWRREQQLEPLVDSEPLPSGTIHIAAPSSLPITSNLLDLDS